MRFDKQQIHVAKEQTADYESRSEWLRQEADYETRSERVRQGAWDEFEQRNEQQKSMQERGQKRPSTPPSAPRSRSQSPAADELFSSSSPVLPTVVPVDTIRNPGESPRSPTRDDIDTLGRPAWPWLPDMTYPASPWVLYKIELKGDEWDGSLGWLETQKELTRRFNGLSADAKADYEAHSERLRQEAWDTYEQRKRDGKKAF
ncbi:hypothetical protein PG996_006583 [Apiospora saccharicola]|uniref:Uncharacterized protein n=1 Tax=Apiospora saccharicola TaxID=335842 RepID=A0ABR1V8F6_9PEZI